MDALKQLWEAYQPLHSGISGFIEKLEGWLESYGEMGFYGCDAADIARLKASLFADGRDLRCAAGMLGEIEKLAASSPAPPAGMAENCIPQACDALDRAGASLDAAATLLDEWPAANPDRFCDHLGDVQERLLEYTTLSPTPADEAFTSDDSGESDDGVFACAAEDGEDAAAWGDDLFVSEAESGLPFDAEKACDAVFASLRGVWFALSMCLDKCRSAGYPCSDAMRLFIEKSESLQADAGAALAGFAQLYAHSDDFASWLSATRGEEALSRFEPDPASALLKLWSDASRMVEAFEEEAKELESRLEKRGGSPNSAAPVSADPPELYAELNRRFAEMLEGKAPPPDDDSDLGPISRQRSFAGWLEWARGGVEFLLREIKPVTHQ